MLYRLGLIFFLVILSGSCKVNHLLDTDNKFYRMDDTSITSSDSSISNLINPFKEQLDSEMNRIIGKVGQTMTKAQPESTLGNWFADLLEEQTEVILGKPIDFAVVNYGGVRIQSIPAGPISKGKIFELMPFDNMVVLVEVDGRTLKQFFNLMAENGGWPISKSVKYKIIDKKATDILINNTPIKNTKKYTISMSDYIANGGSNCSFLADKTQNELGIFLRDLIIEYIETQTEKGMMLGTKIDGRVTASQF